MTSVGMSPERLRWVETWARGWQQSVGGTSDYSLMALDVASAMVLELVEALRDPNIALQLLADVLHESGMEIGEIVERLRGSE